MNLKEYYTKPDDGLFERVGRRLVWHRIWRATGLVVAVASVAAVGVWLSRPADSENKYTASAELITVPAERQVADVSEQVTSRMEERGVHVGESQLFEPTMTSVEPNAAPIATQASEAFDVSVVPTTDETSVQTAQPTLPPVDSKISEDENSILENEIIDSLIIAAGEPDSPQQPKSGTSSGAVQHDNVLWAPNIIVPGDEVAENRVFRVRSTTPVSDFRLAIFNRGGRQIFVANDVLAVWDAGAAPQGTYVWVARFRDADGTVRQEKGTVTVVR